MKFPLTSFLIATVSSVWSQSNEDISRIEFNSGTRTYREQIIFTRDSLIIFQEDFRSDKKPEAQRRKANDKDWNALLHALHQVTLQEVSDLKSPTMNRAHDAAAHGSILITTRNGQSYTHSFDDESPHEKLQPLMKQIRKITGKGKK